MTRRIIVPIGLVLFGCQTGPTAPLARGLPVEPPAIYQRWHAEVEACTGLSEPFASIDWYEMWPGESGSGRWNAPMTIFIHPDARTAERVVKHELVHYLRQQSGHDHPAFGGGSSWGVAEECL